MKLKLLLLTFILVCTGCKNDPRIQAAYDLIERVTPGYGEQFKLELMEPIDGMDAYEITVYRQAAGFRETDRPHKHRALRRVSFLLPGSHVRSL